MTSRGKSAGRGFETEIEKSREEGNWKKAVELALQLKQRSPQHESLAHFLIGEGKLEAHLEEWPACQEHAERALRELGEAKGFLTLATDEAGSKAGVALDAHLLLGKLHYACGEIQDALRHFQLAELSTLTEKELPVRSLRIVAESYAIKGLCLEAEAERATGGSRYKQAERSAEAARALELAADLTLQYVQRTGGGAGALLDAALLRAPALHLRAGRPAQALARTRDMLAAVECPASAPLRLLLARQLAELLLRGAAGPDYQPPRAPPAPQAPHALSDGPWKPRKYTGINLFVPAGAGAAWEEAVLALLVGEALAVRDAVLSQSAEFAAARDHSLRAALAIIDLLALLAARWRQLCLLLESLERAMKFSYGCAHVWRLRALGTAAAAPRPPRAPEPPRAPLAGAGAGAGAARSSGGGAGWAALVRARAVARRAIPLAPDDAPLKLVAANTCYQMGYIEEGISWAEQAAAAEGPFQARALALAGAGHALVCARAPAAPLRARHHELALARLLRAASLDDNDHLALYHLALLHARAARLNDAMDACRACLAARAEWAGGLRLACALWSCAGAGARGARALHVARLARHHYPRAAWPAAALAALQLAWEGGEAALATGKDLLALLSSSEGAEDGSGGWEGLCDDSPRYTELSPHDSPPDKVSLRAESTAGGRSASRALSDSSSVGVGVGATAASLEARAAGWLTLAELCLRLRRAPAAQGCVAEAQALAPHHPDVLYTRGLVHAACNEWEEARGCYVDALALSPSHVGALSGLGAAYLALGWPRLAESCLRSCVALRPQRAATWRTLAGVLAALGDPLAAADCNIAALTAHPEQPALPLPL